MKYREIAIYRHLPTNTVREAHRFDDDASSYELLHWINFNKYKYGVNGVPLVDWINGNMVTHDGKILRPYDFVVYHGLDNFEFVPAIIFSEQYEKIYNV